MNEEQPTAGTWTVYRSYNEDGTLLYVGMTGQGILRLQAHAQVSWWKDVAAITIQHFENRDAARRAEWDAISDENPLHNARRPGVDSAGGAQEADRRLEAGLAQRSPDVVTSAVSFPEPVPGPFDGWTAYVIAPIDESGTTRHSLGWAGHTGEGTTVVLLDDGSFMAAWRRGGPEVKA